jgi:uncharacterized protein YjbI with pentapeptide repeats
MSRTILFFKPALAIMFLTLCVCKPGIGAAESAMETASKPPVSRAELLNRFKAGQWVENKRIRGKDLVALMVGQPVGIRIRNSIVEGGLDFRGAGSPACKSIRIIDASIRPAPTSQRAQSTGSAVYAPDIRFAGTIDLSGTRIEGPVDFSRAAFSGGPVKWVKTHFAGPVDLSGSIFEETVQAQQATFESGVSFSSAQFKEMAVFVDIDVKEKVDAAGSVFRERASFRKSRFRKGSTFRGARFDKSANFMGAVFGGGAVFRNAVFSGPGKFDDAVFDAGVGFEGAAFHQSAAFNRVRFSERVRFSDDAPPQGETDPGATFHGDASFIFTEFVRGGRFAGVRFLGKSQFLDARFGGPARFSEAVFEDRAWFTTSVFHGEATFQKTDFKGNTRFENTRFERFADFLLARFHAEATFDRATFADAVMLEADFGGRVNFRGARFAGRADFAGRTFRGPADFEASIFEARAVFRGASFLEWAQFKKARFVDTLVLDYAAFSSVADFRGARIARLAFDCRTRPTVIEARVDFRKAEIAASHFQDLVFASDVDLSDAVFGHSPPMPETAGDTGDPGGTGSSLGESNRTTLFRDVTFEGATYFIRTHFTGPLSLETVSFRGLSDWREAGFAARDEAIPLLALSYVTFSEANLTWRQLPPIRRWATGAQRIPSFLDHPPAQASEAGVEPETAVRPMQPRSQVLRDLETVFRRQNRLTDANQAHYHLKRAALKEARRKQGWLRRWPLELEWAVWGLLSGYGTRLSWAIGWCLLVVLAFASVYAAFGVLHRQQAPASDNDFSLRLRLLELPRSYLKDAPVHDPAHPLLRTTIDALRLSAVILFKVGYRDTRISGRGGGNVMGWIVALEWLIGFFLIGMLLVTLTNTQPVLHSLLSQLF